MAHLHLGTRAGTYLSIDLRRSGFGGLSSCFLIIFPSLVSIRQEDDQVWLGTFRWDQEFGALSNLPVCQKSASIFHNAVSFGGTCRDVLCK